MAIAYDAFASGTGATFGTTITWAHTVGAISNGILVTVIAQTLATGTITNVAFAGNNLTKVITSEGVDDTELWYLINPPTGLGTFFGTSNGVNPDMAGVSTSYGGVNQGTPIAGSFNGTAAGTLSLADTTLGAGNIVSGGFFASAAAGTISIGTSHGTIADSTSRLIQGDLNTGTLQAKTSSGIKLAGVMAELKVAAAVTGPTVSGWKTLLGAGRA